MNNTLKTIFSCAGTGATVAAATWTVCLKVESAELEGYRASRELGLKDHIKQMEKALGPLSRSAEVIVTSDLEKRELEDLRGRNQHLNQEKLRLETDLTLLRTQNVKLNETLSGIVKDQEAIEIPVNEAKFVIPNTLAVGVKYVIGSDAWITIDGRENRMVAGEFRILTFNDREFALTMTKVTRESCTFTFAARPN